MEEPKDFVTWLQVAKVMVLAYTVGGTAESVWCLWESKTQLGDDIYVVVYSEIQILWCIKKYKLDYDYFYKYKSELKEIMVILHDVSLFLLCLQQSTNFRSSQINLLLQEIGKGVNMEYKDTWLLIL